MPDREQITIPQVNQLPSGTNDRPDRVEYEYGSTPNKLAMAGPNSLSPKEVLQLQRIIGNRSVTRLLDSANQPVQLIKKPPVQKRENHSGLPENLQNGVGDPFAYDQGDAKLHHNSHWFPQAGSLTRFHPINIHAASGHENHPLHNIWPMAQQNQAKVKPTVQTGGIQLKNDSGRKGKAVHTSFLSGLAPGATSVIQLMEQEGTRETGPASKREKPPPPPMVIPELQDHDYKPGDFESAVDNAVVYIDIVMGQRYIDSNHRTAIWKIYESLAQNGFVLSRSPLEMYGKVDYIYWEINEEDAEAQKNEIHDFIRKKIVHKKQAEVRTSWLQGIMGEIASLPEDLQAISDLADKHKLEASPPEQYEHKREIRATGDPMKLQEWFDAKRKVRAYQNIHGNTTKPLG